MAKYKLREKGDQFRPVVEVLKAKNGTPTKVSFNGQEYALVHGDYINGGKSKISQK
jgi:hypothetical protein